MKPLPNVTWPIRADLRFEPSCPLPGLVPATADSPGGGMRSQHWPPGPGIQAAEWNHAEGSELLRRVTDCPHLAPTSRPLNPNRPVAPRLSSTPFLSLASSPSPPLPLPFPLPLSWARGGEGDLDPHPSSPSCGPSRGLAHSRHVMTNNHPL